MKMKIENIKQKLFFLKDNYLCVIDLQPFERFYGNIGVQVFDPYTGKMKQKHETYHFASLKACFCRISLLYVYSFSYPLKSNTSQGSCS